MRDVSKVPDHPSAFDDLPIEKQQRLLSWINESLDPIKTFNTRHTSYGLKHVYESQTRDGEDNYVTNGEFKGAMLKSGFRVKDETALNWVFNISEKSPAFKK